MWPPRTPQSQPMLRKWAETSGTSRSKNMLSGTAGATTYGAAYVSAAGNARSAPNDAVDSACHREFPDSYLRPASVVPAKSGDPPGARACR